MNAKCSILSLALLAAWLSAAGTEPHSGIPYAQTCVPWDVRTRVDDLPQARYELSLKDHAFMNQLDSIINSSAFTKDTKIVPYHVFGKHWGSHDDVPSDILSKTPVIDIAFIDRKPIITEGSYFWNKDVPRNKVKELKNTDISNRSEFYIVACGQLMLSSKYYLSYNKRYYNFGWLPKGIADDETKTKYYVIDHRFPATVSTWIVKCEKGKLTLEEFFIMFGDYDILNGRPIEDGLADSSISCVAQKKRDSVQTSHSCQTKPTPVEIELLNKFRTDADSILANFGLSNRPALIYSAFDRFLVFSPDGTSYCQYFACAESGKIETISSVSPDQWETSKKEALRRKAMEQGKCMLSDRASGYNGINKYEVFLNRDSILDVAFESSTYDRENRTLFEQGLNAMLGESIHEPMPIASVVDYAYFAMLDGKGNRYGEFCIPFQESMLETIAYSGHRDIKDLVILLFMEYL